MNLNLLKYKITPRVILAQKEQTITIEAIERSAKFFDDVEYTITVIRKDDWEYKEGQELNALGRDLIKNYSCFPVNGVIKFTHVYDCEGEWEIKIAPISVDGHVPQHFIDHWPAGKNRMLAPFNFFVYAVEEDIFDKKAFKGDLHIHSFGSDGFESAEFVAARYRRDGYDFIAMTDHYFMQPSFELVERYKDVKGLKVFLGEEVHPIEKGGIFHVVNFNGKSSVNALYRENPQKADREIEEIAKSLNLGNEIDNFELAFFKWIFDKIREVGGIAIYPHAYWQVGGGYHVRKKISEEILKRKLCDAYELFGGMSVRDNRLMTQFYTELRAEGIDLPIVGSSDAHSVLRRDLHYDDYFTIVFSEDKENIPENLLKGYTVAVDNVNKEDKKVFGKLRLVRYAYFLLDEYFCVHDELCRAAGQALTRYVLGEEQDKILAEELEKRVDDFEEVFFGKR